MREYSGKTEPVLAHYRDRDTHVARIDGVGSVSDVRERVRNALEAAIDAGEAGPAPQAATSLRRRSTPPTTIRPATQARATSSALR